MSASTGRRDSKKLGADVDETTEQNLLPFELGAESDHGVKQTAGQPPRSARCPAQMARQTPITTAQPQADSSQRAKALSRIPSSVKRRGFERGSHSHVRGELRIQHRCANLQMRVQRLARNEKPHDL